MLERRRIDQQGVGALAVRDGPDVGDVGFLRRAEIVDERARGRDRRGMSVEAEAAESGRAHLVQQRAPGRFAVERPGVDRRNRQPGGREHGPALGDFARVRRDAVGDAVSGDDDFAGTEDGELVRQRLPPVGARVLGRRELPGRDVEQRDADRLAVLSAARHRHQEGGFACVEIIRVGEGSRRDDPHDFAFDDPFGLAGVLDLVADGHAKPLLDQARDVAVHGVKRHAAHGDGAAIGVFRARGERELERAGGQQGVFVEHLVEVAHPEEQDGVAMLLLRVKILPHRRRRRR